MNKREKKKEIIDRVMGEYKDKPDTHDFDVETGRSEKCNTFIANISSRLCEVISSEEYTVDPR